MIIEGLTMPLPWNMEGTLGDIAMHLKRVNLYPEKYPTREYYPFNLDIFHETKSILFDSPVIFFVGENGTGKSTLLEALTHKCGIYMGGH